MTELSIIIPAYNEEKRIARTLRAYCEFFKQKMDFDVHVIINGCTDNTLGVVEEVAHSYPQIRYVDIGKVGSKGAAVQYGFQIASGNLIGFVDADLATKPEAFYELVQNMKGWDGAIASRWMKGARFDKSKLGMLHKIAGRSFNLLVNLFFSLGIQDTQCGAKLFRKKAIKLVARELGITKWAFDVDLLYKMKRHGFKIREIPTEWSEPGGGHFKVRPRIVLEMFLAILRLRLLYSPLKGLIGLYDTLPARFKISTLVR